MLARNRYYRQLAVRALTRAGVPVYQFQRSEIGEVTSDGSGLRVSSLHGAKGHEFGVVFVVGCVEGVLPLLAGLGDRESVAAEAAVLYVGMTRARDLLYLSYSSADADRRRHRRSSLIDRMAGTIDEVVFRH